MPGLRYRLVLGFTFLSSCLHASDSSPVDVDNSWPWVEHIISIPLVLLIGVFVGWVLHQRKVAQDAARREIEDKA